MTGPRSKVVPFKPGAAGSGKQKDGTAMVSPASLQRLQERCKPLHQQLVQALFDHVDDALFELADKAFHNTEQNMYFESMREVRIKRRGIEQALEREVQEAFRCLGQGVEPDVRDALAADGADALSLVDHDELEEMVAIDGMIAKAEKEYGVALVALNARLETLSNGRPVTLKNNPIGPSHLCRSFFDATQLLVLDIKAKLVLFKLFDRHVIKDLGLLYDAANALLVEEGVLPRMRRGSRTAAPGAAAMAAPADVEAEEVFESLRQLLTNARPQAAHLHTDQRTGLMAPGLAPLLPRDALMQLLNGIQQQQISWLSQQQASILRGVAPQQFDVLNVLNQLLQRKLPNHAVSIGQVDDDAINLVSMLFQFIIEDRNLAAPIKGLVARLQIPILKVAMIDKTFFGKGGHPARKLLNEVANASLGWSPSGAVETDAFYLKIEALVERIVNDFSGDVGLFQDVLTDFVAFVEMERRRATLVEQRTVDAEDGRARSEMARATVQQAIEEKIAGLQLPDAVLRLINDGWSNVLFLVCLKEGTDSESWQLGLRTVDDLLESVSTVDSLVDRARLLRMLPTLLKNLRSGLSKIGFNPFDMNQLFSDLEQIHLQRLRREETASLVREETPVAPAPQPPAAQPAVVAAPLRPHAPKPVAKAQPAMPSRTLDEMLDGREQMHTIENLDRELADQLGDFADLDHDSAEVRAEETLAPEFAAAPAAPEAPKYSEAERKALTRVDQLQVGGWVELQQDGHPVRCRLAAVIRTSGKYIFVNRAGIKVAENNREGLAHAYMTGVLNILDDGRLFDRALESVIGNLREMKGRQPG